MKTINYYMLHGVITNNIVQNNSVIFSSIKYFAYCGEQHILCGFSCLRLMCSVFQVSLDCLLYCTFDIPYRLFINLYLGIFLYTYTMQDINRNHLIPCCHNYINNTEVEYRNPDTVEAFCCYTEILSW
jgi:hypothetical protein